MSIDRATGHLASAVDRLEDALAARLKTLQASVAALTQERDDLAHAAAQTSAPAPNHEEMAELQGQWEAEKAAMLLQQEHISSARATEVASATAMLDKRNAEIQQLTHENEALNHALHEALTTVDGILASLKDKVAL